MSTADSTTAPTSDEARRHRAQMLEQAYPEGEEAPPVPQPAEGAAPAEPPASDKP